ncbi:hypothetical protein FRX31_008390 [Thalictrum thalictroides]|uniref:Uncharacterized protein n=1 Tax=Thalictrum thalictroides TaxID=46969 RepID=A0A7J6X0U3_THATH|nr:hypothetical protein FRX31_008390 [Thalictrum thalictroides]
MDIKVLYPEFLVEGSYCSIFFLDFLPSMTRKWCFCANYYAYFSNKLFSPFTCRPCQTWFKIYLGFNHTPFYEVIKFLIQCPASTTRRLKRFYSKSEKKN